MWRKNRTRDAANVYSKLLIYNSSMFLLWLQIFPLFYLVLNIYYCKAYRHPEMKCDFKPYYW